MLGADRSALDRVEHDGVVARGRGLVRVREVHPALLELGPSGPGARDDDRRTALAHPDRGLVRSLEAVDGRVGVAVGRDGVAVEACLGDPAGHGEGRGGGGDHAPRAVGRVSTVADEAESESRSAWNWTLGARGAFDQLIRVAVKLPKRGIREDVRIDIVNGAAPRLAERIGCVTRVQPFGVGYDGEEDEGEQRTHRRGVGDASSFTTPCSSILISTTSDLQSAHGGREGESGLQGGFGSSARSLNSSD